MTDRVVRPSARVIVVDADGRVLLARIDDPHDDNPPVWITPGGAVENGETERVAAARELAEETGLAVPPGDLLGPVAVCQGEWVHRGTPLRSVDWFFAVRTARFAPDEGGFTDLEREIHAGWRWWAPAAIDSTTEVVLPSGLAGLVRLVSGGEVPPEPVELPWVTV